jgi:GDPmannose 4,6-dehydratase
MELKEYEDTRVLVTGCTGFVGQYIVQRLLDLNAEVYGLDRWKTLGVALAESLPAEQQKRFKMISANLRDISSLANVLDISEPSYIIHLAAQSYVPESFLNPVDTMNINALGTCNLLESVRQKDCTPRIVFAGSSEEYGLVFYSQNQLQRIVEKYGGIFPFPSKLPEVPISEKNPLRPMSPYAVSKVAGDFLMRNYYHTYGVETVVSRAFNHEGAGRGSHFVTALIARQVMQLKYGERDCIVIGNVSAFRDWSHVSDIVNGYLTLALHGKPGEVYNQGSERTNSVLTYILLALEQNGMRPESLSTITGDLKINDPVSWSESEHFGSSFLTTKIDRMLLDNELEFTLSQKGLIIVTKERNVKVDFNPERFRPSEVPILLSLTKKIQKLGFEIKYSLRNIVDDQLNYYLDSTRRAM